MVVIGCPISGHVLIMYESIWSKCIIITIIIYTQCQKGVETAPEG